MNESGPTSEGYFQAVSGIAASGLKRFGLKNFRMWCEGSGGEYGGEAITKFIKEEVGYSSWIQSDAHVRMVVRFTRHIAQPVITRWDIATSKELYTLSLPLPFLRGIAAQAMQQDVKDERTRLLVKYIPKYWKLRFVKADRFAVYADFEEQDSEVDYKATEPEIHEAKARLEAQYTAAKLPVPQIVLVGFNSEHQEIKE